MHNLEINMGKGLTVEHLLAAFYIGMNALVEINCEVPIMDGSAKDFLEVYEK